MQIAYREVIKELLPENLYPSKNELRVALEEYLTENDENYISTIGKNTWISLFAKKLYFEINLL